MVDMAEAVVTVTKASAPKAAGTVTDQARDDPADPDQAHETDDQAEPFRVRGGERQRGDHNAAAD